MIVVQFIGTASILFTGRLANKTLYQTWNHCAEERVLLASITSDNKYYPNVEFISKNQLQSYSTFLGTDCLGRCCRTHQFSLKFAFCIRSFGRSSDTHLSFYGMGTMLSQSILKVDELKRKLNLNNICRQQRSFEIGVQQSQCLQTCRYFILCYENQTKNYRSTFLNFTTISAPSIIEFTPPNNNVQYN